VEGQDAVVGDMVTARPQNRECVSHIAARVSSCFQKTNNHEMQTEEEQVKLTLLIVAIARWNRIQIGFRAVHPMTEDRAA